MNEQMTVGEVARLAGVTVRTLHHYDEIGLVATSSRNEAGYRLYGPAEIARLQEVLLLRELGMSLEKIASAITDPSRDRPALLRRHRRSLQGKIERLQRMVASVDLTLATEDKGELMSAEDMLEVFADFDPTEYEAEVEERWGDSDAYRESARRTKGYSRQDWERMRAESSEIDAALVSLMESGEPGDGPAAREVAERHRLHISKWFYECPPAMHAALGQMYVTDVRFAERMDATAPGLAAYLAEAIDANAAVSG